MQVEARVPLDPGLNARMFMGTVIVDDQMQIHFRRSFKVDCFKEPNKLLVSMPRHAVADDSSVQGHHCSKQSRCAIALVIMRHGAATTFS